MDKDLLEVVASEYKKNTKKWSDQDTTFGECENMDKITDFCAKILYNNYEEIKGMYERNGSGVHRFNEKNQYRIMLSNVVKSLYRLVLADCGHRVEKEHKALPCEFGALSLWVDWYGFDQPEFNDDNDIIENEGFINSKGRKVLEDLMREVYNTRSK